MLADQKSSLSSLTTGRRTRLELVKSRSLSNPPPGFENYPVKNLQHNKKRLSEENVVQECENGRNIFSAPSWNMEDDGPYDDICSKHSPWDKISYNRTDSKSRFSRASSSQRMSAKDLFSSQERTDSIWGTSQTIDEATRENNGWDEVGSWRNRSLSSLFVQEESEIGDSVRDQRSLSRTSNYDAYCKATTKDKESPQTVPSASTLSVSDSDDFTKLSYKAKEFIPKTPPSERKNGKKTDDECVITSGTSTILPPKSLGEDTTERPSQPTAAAQTPEAVPVPGNAAVLTRVTIPSSAAPTTPTILPFMLPVNHPAVAAAFNPLYQARPVLSPAAYFAHTSMPTYACMCATCQVVKTLQTTGQPLPPGILNGALGLPPCPTFLQRNFQQMTRHIITGTVPLTVPVTQGAMPMNVVIQNQTQVLPSKPKDSNPSAADSGQPQKDNDEAKSENDSESVSEEKSDNKVETPETPKSTSTSPKPNLMQQPIRLGHPAMLPAGMPPPFMPTMPNIIPTINGMLPTANAAYLYNPQMGYTPMISTPCLPQFGISRMPPLIRPQMMAPLVRPVPPMVPKLISSVQTVRMPAAAAPLQQVSKSLTVETSPVAPLETLSSPTAPASQVSSPGSRTLADIVANGKQT